MATSREVLQPPGRPWASTFRSALWVYAGYPTVPDSVSRAAVLARPRLRLTVPLSTSEVGGVPQSRVVDLMEN